MGKSMEMDFEKIEANLKADFDKQMEALQVFKRVYHAYNGNGNGSEVHVYDLHSKFPTTVASPETVLTADEFRAAKKAAHSARMKKIWAKKRRMAAR